MDLAADGISLDAADPPGNPRDRGRGFGASAVRIASREPTGTRNS